MTFNINIDRYLNVYFDNGSCLTCVTLKRKPFQMTFAIIINVLAIAAVSIQPQKQITTKRCTNILHIMIYEFSFAFDVLLIFSVDTHSLTHFNSIIRSQASFGYVTGPTVILIQIVYVNRIFFRLTTPDYNSNKHHHQSSAVGVLNDPRADGKPPRKTSSKRLSFNPPKQINNSKPFVPFVLRIFRDYRIGNPPFTRIFSSRRPIQTCRYVRSSLHIIRTLHQSLSTRTATYT